ncbi:MAG: glycosyltransferase family 4 protein [Nitrospiraceae bacterium]|nr:MAG: glycosyltransferase family 4 protein [Nitrospiraceae bacterium]
MKILHLLYESKGDYFGIGGVGIRAYNIYHFLKDRHDITLLCRKYPGARDREIKGLKHNFVGTESKNFTKTLLSYAYHSTRYVRKHGNEFDMIIEDFSPAIPTFLNFYHKRPLVLQVQGYTGRQYFKKYKKVYSLPLYILERFLPKRYKDIILVSDVTKKRLNLNDKHNIQDISNGIPEEIFTIETGESDYILFLGRIDIYQKGLDILFSAFVNFHKKFPDIRLVVAGDCRDREKFKTILEYLPHHLKKNIELTGWVEKEKKKSLLKDSLFVVIPSRHETQGIVALEAMAYGKPVVVSDIKELKYVIDCGAGISFKSGNAISLAQCMIDCISGNERKAMGSNGRETVKDFTWRKIALKYENFLFSVLANRDRT